MLAAWLAFPLILVVLCGGAGLLVERVGGHPLPGALVLPLGFCALVGVTQLAVTTGGLAAAATPLAVAVGLVGLWLGRGRLRAARVDGWAVVAGVAVFLSFGAASFLTGHVGFLSYGNLGDASIHFELVDRIMHHGRSIAGLAPSTFSLSLEQYFLTSYPTGAHTVLGVGRALTGADVAWLFQPYLALLAALLTAALVPLASTMTPRRWLAAGMAGTAAQSSILFSYAIGQQAIKELASLVTIATVVALVRPLLDARPTWRSGLPLAVGAGGALGVLSVAVAPWVGPVLLVALGGLVVRHRRVHGRAIGLAVLAFAVVGGVLAIPSLRSLNAFVATSNVTLTSAKEFGNLQRDLSFWQAFGVWPWRDFRELIPADRVFNLALIGVPIVLAVLGVIAVARRRAWPLALFVAVSLVGFIVVAGRASPWAYGKSLAILSPALVLLATAACAGLWELRRRPEAVVLAVALLVGVAWSDAQAYHAAAPAPQQRLQELARIGERFAGQGPSAYFEFEEFGKHFLRQTAPTGVVESYRPAAPVAAAGRSVRFGFSSDPDTWDARSLRQSFELLVLRRGPAVSRPPLGFRRVFAGRFYDVWRRVADGPDVLAQIGFGDRLDAGGPVDCAAVQGLSATARAASGRLAWVPRRVLPTFRPATLTTLPANWTPDGGDSETLRPVGPGRVQGTVSVSGAGRYRVWAEASVVRPATVRVDGRVVGRVTALNPRLSATALGSVRLAAGTHTVRIDVGGGSLAPGNGATSGLLGPVTLTRDDDPAGDAPVRTLPASRWRSLCGRRADWVAAVS